MPALFRQAAALLAVCASTALAAPLPGWTLYSGMTSTETTLVDLNGAIVKTWPSDYNPGASVYLIDDGSILRTARDLTLSGPVAGGAGGRIQIIGWDGTLEWDYELAGEGFRQHHDVCMLPSGNVLAIVWESKTAAEAIAAGRDPESVGSEVWSEVILEIEPTGPTTGEVVWSWRVWDALVQDFDPMLPNFGDPADHPGRIDINFAPNGTNPDWLHFNGLDYNAELDQIVISCHAFDELWVISHAPGASPELLYRWGNPQAYGRGTADDQRLFNQHNAQWIDEGLPGAGNLLVYNNGNGRPAPAPGAPFSSVDEITPPLNPDGTYTIDEGLPYGPAAPAWTCDNAGGTPFYSSFISGAQRLANGNTLICVGASGEFIEVDPSCMIEWVHAPGGAQFRCTRIPDRDSRLAGLLFCTADINGDGSTDAADLSVLVGAFGGAVPPGTSGDLNGDGAVDGADLAVFIGDFGCEITG